MSADLAAVFEQLPEDLQRFGTWFLAQDGELQLGAWSGDEDERPLCELCCEPGEIVATIAIEVETGERGLILVCRRCLAPREDA